MPQIAERGNGFTELKRQNRNRVCAGVFAMPSSGGAADKLGNRYEAIWAIDQLLRIVDGAAHHLILEPLDPDESRGIEFQVANADDTLSYWSVKRQTARAAGWTLALLAKKDRIGRSILGDLLAHVECSSTNRGVFASSLAAPRFQELREHAGDSRVLEARLRQSFELRSDFADFLLPYCDGDQERARQFLLKTLIHAIDERQLRERVHFGIHKLFYSAGLATMDVDVARLLLGDLLLDRIHQPIDLETILGYLKSHGFLRRDWAVEKTVIDRIATICDSYSAPLKSQLIGGEFLPLAEPNAILASDAKPSGPKILVVAGAGGGKSCTLSATLGRLRSKGIPVLPIRFDQLADGLMTTTELGQRLFLPESPTLVLAGVASGGPCVLIVDQLDTVSVASGRRVEVWSLFEQLCREAQQFPSLSLIVGCREFDLEHDHRMRQMKATGTGFQTVKLKSLSLEQVTAALRNAGADSDAVSTGLKTILAVPLHLSMYLTLSAADRTGVVNRDDLFDHFWVQKERQTDQRLGRKTSWTAVIDRLSKWLSDNQQLSAPRHVLDEFAADASAMASEHVIALADERYRFFHESFFDYAFARRFAAAGGRLTDLLLTGEQHLFRRAQVRQVLAYLRTKDPPRYLEELDCLLVSADVRFHIKSLVLQWMSSLTDPCPQEWAVLEKLRNAQPGIHPHIRGVVVGRPGWFDVLDVAGFFDRALSSGEKAREEEAIWLLERHEVLKSRSARIAELLRTHRKDSDLWRQYLRYMCRHGEVFHSRQMFDLFLQLIDDGTLDGLRPAFAVNDSWWMTLYAMAENKPELACEAIGRWFDRVVALWRQSGDESRLWQVLDRTGDGTFTILKVARATQAFAEQLLPRVAKLIAETATPRDDRLDRDPLWCSRSFGDNPVQNHSAILSCLAQSLESLAKTAPFQLDRLLDPYTGRPQDAITYLLLRAWTSAPEVYADRLVDYLVTDPRRLKVGYGSWSADGGSAAIHVSSRAVKASSSRCTPQRLAALELSIINLKDEYEAQYPAQRGRIQLELLQSFELSRLSAAGRAKLDELRAKFPTAEFAEPVPGAVKCIGSPIPSDAQAKMSDDQWLGALHKYAGVDHRNDRRTAFSGGERQLAQALDGQTKQDPIRFVALAAQMPDSLPATYFDAILQGVTNCIPQPAGSPPPIPFEQVISLLRRVHRLPGKPCGQSIAYLVKKWAGADWPEDILEDIAWYATNDPDPAREVWKTHAESGQPLYGGDPLTAGMNSARGAVALAVAQLLFDNPDRLARLDAALDSLVHDRSVAVRSCAIEALRPVLNVAVGKAVSWFTECVSIDSTLLSTPSVESFVHFAGYRDYAGIRAVISAMLSSSDAELVETGARLVCLLALETDAASPDAERVRAGSIGMRKAAAKIYSHNVAHETVGPVCRELLKPLLADPDDTVRTEAAVAFRMISSLATHDQADLLAAFLDSQPARDALEPVVRALEDSPVQLPDLVCRLAEQCVEAYKADASDLSKAGAGVAMDLSKIVIRLYTQTENTAIQTRCLALIDEMERYHFIGLSDEMKQLDR
jgi:hypothetical protein